MYELYMHWPPSTFVCKYGVHCIFKLEIGHSELSLSPIEFFRPLTIVIITDVLVTGDKILSQSSISHVLLRWHVRLC